MHAVRLLAAVLALAVHCISTVESSTPTPSPLHLVNITADIFILQYHFKLTGEESLTDWIKQLRNYGQNYGPKSLPRTLLWRVAPPALRDDPSNNFPSMLQNIQAIRAIRQLYSESKAKGPKFVYYPDVETQYADLWGTTLGEKKRLRKDPTLAVSIFVPRDLARWHLHEIIFNEVIIEEFGAPISAAATGTLVSATMLALRRSPLMAGLGLSLTPDFSVLGGRCKSNVQDDCALLVGNRTGISPYPSGAFYTQAYNIYTENNGAVVLTDVTPWSSTSKAQACGTITEPSGCVSSCCEWVGDDNRCVPITWDNSTLTACLIPDPGLCAQNRLEGCSPRVGSSIYSQHYSAAQAAQAVATIFIERVLSRCHPGGAAIEVLDSHTFWHTFPAIFSYEPWSAPGPPLYLMGNPTYTYTNSMWSQFISSFKSGVKRGLSGAHGLCGDLSDTAENEIQIGVYWARQAMRAWNQTSPVGG